MALIDRNYFNFEINLPVNANSDLSNYIDRFEPEILKSLLGYELYTLVAASTDTSGRLYDLINGKEYTVAYNGRDQKVKWEGLVNADHKSLIAYYVYYQFQRCKATLPGASGEVKLKHESSFNADLHMKIMDAWSRMRELYGYAGQSELQPSAYNFLMANESDYPEWIFTEIGSMNAFDI
jgi:hypothetical protein